MWHIGKRIGPPLLGAALLSLLGLAPAAAQGIYGGTGGTTGSSYSAGSPSVYTMPTAPYGAAVPYRSTYGAQYSNYFSPATSAYGDADADDIATNVYGSRLYTIRFGDTLGRIALRFHTTVRALLRANPRIVNPNLIFAGQRLVIPAGGSVSYSTGGYAAPGYSSAAPYAPPAGSYPAAPMAPMPMQPQPATPSATPMPGQQTVNVDLTAHNIAFSLSAITVPAGAHVVVHFTNQDPVPHNLAVYTDSSAQQVIFRGQVVTGPNASVTYEFNAPSQPGTYFFRCDVHPTQITGSFIVR